MSTISGLSTPQLVRIDMANAEAVSMSDEATTGVEQFPGRLKLLIGDRSVRSFARDVGISDKMLRQYLAARSEPTRLVLVAIANAAGGVSLDWLITGVGDMSAPTPSSKAGGTDVSVLENITRFPQQRAPITADDTGKISAKDEFVAWLNQWWRGASPRERAWLEIQLEAYVPQFVSWRKQLRRKLG